MHVSTQAYRKKYKEEPSGVGVWRFRITGQFGNREVEFDGEYRAARFYVTRHCVASDFSIDVIGVFTR